MSIVVVAGEPSGDRAIASVLRALAPVESFGFGGDAMAEVGTELVAHVRDLSGMGVVEVISRAARIARGVASLFSHVDRRRPSRAILASWSAMNARIGARLRARGVHVTWISPPEVWAWGRWRTKSLVRSADRFALTLPFEVALWKSAGADASYVGHPALDVSLASRASIRARLALDANARAIAILPGSRPAEVRMLAPFFLAAARFLRSQISLNFRLIIAPDLPHDLAAWLANEAASAAIESIDAPNDEGAIALLPAFDAALVASGTASLECALARVPPVVAYRMNAVTFAIARRVVKTPYIALPNVVLAREAFAERVQSFDANTLARDVLATLDANLAPSCDEVITNMRAGLDERSFAERVARLVGR